MNKVVILSGPTATGKTAWAIRLAQALKAHVVNFDSLLLYRELNIGTAKPNPLELSSAPHHMIGVTGVQHPMNAADYAVMARPLINHLHQAGHPVILTGGSGFYLQALVAGMWASPTTPPEVSERSDALYQQEGIAPFRALLEQHDRESFLRLHENDHYRVRRAVEHFWAHGSAFSEAREAFTPTPPPSWRLLHLHLDLPREEHLAIIRQRTRQMLQDGLISEVEGLLKNGCSGTEKPLQAIGYKETLDWLQGVYGADLAAYEERIVISTRRLAKSQRTWFKKKEKFVFHPQQEGVALLERAKDFISQA